MVRQNPIETLIEKNKKYLSKMNFKDKALYSILLDCNDPLDLIENVLNPLINDIDIDDSVIEMYCLKNLYKDKKAKVKLFKNILEIITKSPKLNKDTYIYLCVDYKYVDYKKGKVLNPNKTAKELGNIFLPISEQLDNPLVCIDVEDIAKKAYNRCFIFKIKLSKGLQLLPIRYTINNKEYHSLIIPPIYKWKMDRYSNIKLEIIENASSKLTLVEQLRLISRHSHIPIMEFTLK